MQIRMIIFAMDGIICHLDKYHYLAWKTIADELGIPFSEIQGKELIGLSRMDSLNRILEQYPGTLSQAEKIVLAEQKNEEFRRIIENLSRKDCDTEVENNLINLKAKGYLLAVTSPSRNVYPILEKLELITHFDYISDGNIGKTVRGKNNRYLRLCEDAGIKPEECALVDGTVRGIRAGKGAGMVTFSTMDSLLEYIKVVA